MRYGEKATGVWSREEKKKKIAGMMLCNLSWQSCFTTKGSSASLPYAALDDGSERIILLSTTALKHGIQGTDESLALRMTCHQCLLPMQSFKHVCPLVLIGADHTNFITPTAPVRLVPPGGPGVIKTRLVPPGGPAVIKTQFGWMLQGPAQLL